MEAAVGAFEDAGFWWKTIDSKWTSSNAIRTWELFTTEFNNKYILASGRRDSELAFLQLEQKNKTVQEYEKEFTALARHASYLVERGDRKAKKFETGLNPDIQEAIAPLNIFDYHEIVDRALNIERTMRLIKGKEGADNRTEHIKKYCPQLKNKSASSSIRDTKEKKFKPRKALLTWDDSDENDKEMSENDDIAQLCFMAKDDHLDEVIASENFDYDKLELAFLELSENHEKLKLKNVALKKKALSLLNNVEELEGEKEELDERIEFYITENASLKMI
ncbi:hypothetical protein RJ640_010121 [Escallonia rubra]|uniref:Retrotransposon gag domain-containing protein n=1 Tax=Escallonia rubra TaxID=112253 RepID=A0AA88SCI3_9ASTE|nr:hypothetical protein RJ640_010121 [Escallonia rubra]